MFDGMSDEEFKSYLGIPVELIQQREELMNSLLSIGSFAQTEQDMLSEVPDSFDWRKENSSCISEVRDQKHCGSCWAFSGTSTLADRVCINSNGSSTELLSPQDLVSCDTVDAHGCHGATITASWEFFSSKGVVSDSCYPYTSGEGVDGTCQAESCPTTKTTEPVQLGTEASWKKEIMNNGPIQAAFIVYSDFKGYKSGV